MKILIVIDIVVRGIDISGFKYVINYDVFNVLEIYVYCIGWLGRVGEEGIVIFISGFEENVYIKDIEKFIKNKFI